MGYTWLSAKGFLSFFLFLIDVFTFQYNLRFLTYNTTVHIIVCSYKFKNLKKKPDRRWGCRKRNQFVRYLYVCFNVFNCYKLSCCMRLYKFYGFYLDEEVYVGLRFACFVCLCVLEWVMLLQFGFLVSPAAVEHFILCDDLIDFTVCTKWEWKWKIDCITWLLGGTFENAHKPFVSFIHSTVCHSVGSCIY